MADNSAIEWTDATWNVVLGCDRVSPGCDGCYAIRTAHRMGANPDPKIADAYAGLVERSEGRLDWTGQVNLVEARLALPLHWTKPRRIFVNAQSDLFHDDVPDEFIGSVFEVMAKTPQHTYQILTKRHGRMRSLLNRWADEGRRHDWAGPGTAVFRRHDMCWVGPVRWPLPNVWLGVSVEDQQRADLRIPALLDTPAAVRFLSCEPLLGPVDLLRPVDEFGGRTRMTYWLTGRPGFAAGTPVGDSGLTLHDLTIGPRIDWVIVGGESGPGARPMHSAWARQLRDQCAAADVPFFFKQWGESAPLDQLPETAAASWEIRNGAGYPEATMCHVGKKAAGRELDGRTWDQYPAVPA